MKVVTEILAIFGERRRLAPAGAAQAKAPYHTPARRPLQAASGRAQVWLALALLFSSTACGGGSSSGEKSGELKIEFWHAMGARTHQEMLQKYADEFNAAHPGVRVEPVFQGVYGTMYQKLIAAVTARKPPALAMMYESWTTRLMDRGRIDPAENYVRGERGYSEAELADFYPAYLENNRWRGKLATLPFNKSAYVLVYNQDLFERAGLAAAPATQAELRAAADALAALGEREGRAIRAWIVRPQLEAFATLAMAAGEELLDSEGRAQFESEGSRAALRFLTDAIGAKAAHVEEAYPANAFGAGDVGMYIYSSAAFPFNDRFSEGKFRWRAAPVPPPAAAGEGARRALFQGMNVAIMKDRSAEERAAAWEFLKFMLEPERAAAWAMLTGYCPVRKSALGRPEMQAWLAEHPNYAVPFGEAERAAFEPKLDFWESARGALNSEVGDALHGIKSADEALAAAARKAEEARMYDSKSARAAGEGGK